MHILLSKLVQNSMLIGQLKNQLSLKKSLKLTEEKKQAPKDVGHQRPEEPFEKKIIFLKI